VTVAPLSGRRVVVTRTRQQASVMVERLAALGATVIELPVIAIEDPDDDGAALASAAVRTVQGSYRWVVVTSPNAAARFLDALGERSVPSGLRWAAVGRGTAQILTEGGHRPDLVPTTSIAEALVDAFPAPGPDDGGGVLFPRAASVRGTLADGLRTAGWAVDEVIAYRTVAGRPDERSVAEARKADAIAFTSSSTVDRSLDLLGLAGMPPVVVTIGPVTSATARGVGLTVTEEAAPHTIQGLVDALVRAFDR
jgi:uroporphyrinogen III methyltransferase/synthase